MRDPAEIAATLAGCIVCGRNPIVATGYFVPVGDECFTAVMRLRERPIVEGHTPTICYGLCRKHARNVERALGQVEARILAAASEVTVQ